MTAGVLPVSRRARRQLVFAGGAVLLAAADTYVVVMALTAIMFDVGISIDKLQQAAPIISGFLVGYVAVLPLLGRLSDLYGRQPVFIACLLAFALGSLLTASGTTLAMVVAGRALQGLGGGGLVPVTLALIADLWPAERRGAPLGIVTAVQEFGSVVGPLYGAAILALTTWRVIFWINLPLVAILAAGLWFSRPCQGRMRAASTLVGQRDYLGGMLLAIAVVAGVAAITAPTFLTGNVIIGALYGPVIGTVAVTTPVTIIAIVATATFCAWETLELGKTRPLLRLRALPELMRRADWLGSLLISSVLAAIVISFAVADPASEILGGTAAILLPLAVLASVWFVFHERRCTTPLIDFAAVGNPAAIGAVLSNLFIGCGLMAALVDVPIFARTTAYPTSQLDAALVLLHLLAAVPVGAIIGGMVCRRTGYRLITAVAMLLSGGMFAVMAHWNAGTLTEPLFGAGWIHPSDVTLAVCGLGFGLAIAPVNAAILGAVEPAWHGLASSLVVVARSVGMLVGLSALTAVGLQRFHAVASILPSPQQLCPNTPTQCAAYDVLSRDAIISELHAIFLGAAIACGVAACLAAAMLRRHGGGERSMGVLLGGA